VCAPAGVPPALLDKLNADIIEVMRIPELEKRLGDLGMPPAPTTRDEFDKFIRARSRAGRSDRGREDSQAIVFCK
jgi:tripartite-type tricarboxylate transporter receptor subunit TctC